MPGVEDDSNFKQEVKMPSMPIQIVPKDPEPWGDVARGISQGWIAGKQAAYGREQDEKTNARNDAKVLQSIMKDLPEDVAAKVREHPFTIELEKRSGLPLTSLASEETGKSKWSKENARQAVAMGKPLEGYTMDETKKLAGVYISKGGATTALGDQDYSTGIPLPKEKEGFRWPWESWGKKKELSPTIEPKGGSKKEVKVKSPDGVLGTIPSEQLEEAIKAGYEVVR